MATCKICSKTSKTISQALGVCLTCIREKPKESLKLTENTHRQSRAAFGLPQKPPDDPSGVACAVCVNQCRISENGLGYCICYFGGDPSPQLPFSLKVSRQAIEQNKDRILRICWETNGSMRPDLLDDMMELALDSGGCVKFDLKARDFPLHKALTGVTNERTLENFARAATVVDRRRDPPVLIANSLLVPGYIDEQEIGAIAKFVADLDPDIPYSLLAFHPQFYMSDLPVTSKDHAERCYQAARDAGLNNVRIGNVHLLN